MTDKSDERKAVPREPTDDMGDAGYRVLSTKDDAYKCVTHVAEAVWRAMYDAAPVLATAPAEPPNEEIAMSSGTLREAARWLDTGKGRRPDGCTLRCIADLIDRLEPSPPSGEVAAQLAALQEKLNSPVTRDFLEGVMCEAAHQRERWGSDHDAGKAPEDWFWLVGYLAGKALHAAKGETLPRYRHIERGGTYEVVAVSEDENNRGTTLIVYRGEDDGKIWSRPSAQFFDGRFEELPSEPKEKALHHTISAAAALCNWHAVLLGTDNSMRPGIDPNERKI